MRRWCKKTVPPFNGTSYHHIFKSSVNCYIQVRKAVSPIRRGSDHYAYSLAPAAVAAISKTAEIILLFIAMIFLFVPGLKTGKKCPGCFVNGQ